MHDLLPKDVFQYRIDLAMTIYLCTLVEYIANDVLKLADHYVTNIRHDKIHAQDVRIAINADKSLTDLLYGEEEEYESRQEFSNLSMIMEETTEEGTDDEGITYETVVKELVQEAKHFIKDLNFIIKVFRDPLIKILNSPASQPTLKYHGKCKLKTRSMSDL
ncbi:son of sevenless homolog 1-like [Brevipalpus obovatus]|uniref:son of sevenless homolog 1-like n=1 Tax=Brevipalpus obovatus TaxID=246614 RepID=UPI003D9DCDEA